MCTVGATMIDATCEAPKDYRARAQLLSWMASLSVAAGELRAAEGYLLELLALCAFGGRESTDLENEV